MADTDLTEKASAQTIKVTGSDSTGVENAFWGATQLDTANSSTAALAANATFTGTFVNCEQYSNLTVQIFANVVSAASGLIIEYSHDGATVDDNDSFSIVANNGQTYSFGLASKFYRIRYVNGATIQTTFSLQAKLHLGRPKPSTHRIAEVVTDEHDAELGKSAINARDYNSTGTGPVRMTSNNDLGIADILDNGGVNGQIAVPANTATAIRVGGANLANRKRLLFIPLTGTAAWWGFSNAVTNANGIEVFKNQPVSDSWGPNTTIWIYSTVAITVQVAEAA